MSLYVLSLSALPCTDSTDTEVEDVSFEQAQVSATIQAQDICNDIEIDNCSPFCTCHCCHVYAAFSSTKFVVDILETPNQFKLHQEKLFSNNYFPYWHPPKV